MKKFIQNIIYIGFFIFILSIGLDFFISEKMKTKAGLSQGEFISWNRINNDSILNEDVLIYGSSRARCHFNPQIITDSLNLTCYNYGIEGHNFWIQYLRHKKITQKGPIKNIIMNVDFMTFIKKKDLYNYNQFMPYMLWDKDFYTFTNSYDIFNYSDYYVPLKRFYGRRELLSTVFNNDYLTKESFQLKGHKSINKNFQLNQMQLNDIPNDTLIFHEKTIELFDQFLSECQSSNTKLTLVFSPELYHNQQKTVNRSKLITIIHQFVKKYNLDYLDYSNHQLSMSNEYYFDMKHLNKKGADQFTKDLVGKLKLN